MGGKTYLVQFKYPNDVRFSMLIITHPQTTVRGRKKDRASLKNESSWLRGTRTISPHRQQPRNVSFFHPSVKKRRWIYPQLLICTFCFAVQRRRTTSNQSTIKKSLHDRTNTFFDKSSDVTGRRRRRKKRRRRWLRMMGGGSHHRRCRDHDSIIFSFFYKK